jgi:hypothetical protein
MTLADEVSRSLERPVEVIESYLVELLLGVHSYDVVAEGNEGHADRFDSAQ